MRIRYLQSMAGSGFCRSVADEITAGEKPAVGPIVSAAEAGRLITAGLAELVSEEPESDRAPQAPASGHTFAAAPGWRDEWAAPFAVAGILSIEDLAACDVAQLDALECDRLGPATSDKMIAWALAHGEV